MGEVHSRTMDAEQKLPEQLQEALKKGLLQRLPLTFRPFTQQQLREWDYLFPYERKSLLRMLLYIADLSKQQFGELFREILQIEEKMGARGWQFSSDQQTILNASLLARSPYYQEWRRAVQKIFDEADEHSTKSKDVGRHRLILLSIPQRLPLRRSNLWKKWQNAGRPLTLDLSAPGNTHTVGESLIPELVQVAARHADHSVADAWVFDASASGSAVEAILDSSSAQKPSDAQARLAVLLSNERLASIRDHLAHEINTIRKDLADADAVFDHLRKADIAPWCPAEVASRPVIREFLRSLYLSGNGALVFGNSFVEWGAAEAFRRARPTFLAAQFGVRSKPKPFTNVAVFENPDRVNPLPAVDDLEGSTLDAQMLALYVWLAASRYDEYQRNTVCLCVAESLWEAYVIAPPEASLWHEREPISLDRLRSALASWLHPGTP